MTARHEIAHADAQRQARGAASKAKGEERQRFRDEFAMAALTGIASQRIPQSEQAIKAMAECAYMLADAMMAERGK